MWFCAPSFQVIMVSAILMHELWTPALCHRSPSNAALFCLSQRSDKRVPQILTDHVALQVGLTLYVAGWGIGPSGPELGQSILSTLKLEAHQLLDAPPGNKSMLWDGDIHRGMVCGLAQEGQANCIGKRKRSRTYLSTLLVGFKWQQIPVACMVIRPIGHALIGALLDTILGWIQFFV